MPLDFATLCERGEAADMLYNTARYEEAERAYLELYEKMRLAGPINMYVAAKIALGLLLTWIESGQVERAFKLWTSSPSQDLGEGIYAIEHGQTGTHDLAAYEMVSAFLHSLSADDRNAATEAVNELMKSVCTYASAFDPLLLPVAIKDWKQFLMHLHGNVVPHEEAAAVLAEEKRYGRPIEIDGIDFPPPWAWRPRDEGAGRGA